MARLIRSPRARRDVAEVLRYTRDRWGKAQAREYRDLINAALKAIIVNPGRGKAQSTRPGVLSYHIKQPGRHARHIVFYRVRSSGVLEIIRLLHDSMDFDRHLP